MTAVAFDTLRLARALRDKAKFSPEQAEGLADAIAEAMQQDVATKGDIRDLEARLREAEANLKAQIETSKAEVLKQIETSKTEVLKWMFGAIGFQTVVIVGAVIALSRLAVH